MGGSVDKESKRKENVGERISARECEVPSGGWITAVGMEVCGPLIGGRIAARGEPMIDGAKRPEPRGSKEDHGLRESCGGRIAAAGMARAGSHHWRADRRQGRADDYRGQVSRACGLERRCM